MALDLIGIDGWSDKVRRYSGFSSTIVDSFTISGIGRGVASDGTDIFCWRYSGGIEKIIRTSGFSSTIKDSFVISTTPNSLDWFDGNLYRHTGGTIKKHSGFSSTITDSITPAGPEGVWFDEDGNLYTARIGGEKPQWDDGRIYKCSGFSAVVLDSFDLPGPGTSIIKGTNAQGGLVLDDDGNVIACTDIENTIGGDGADKYYKFSGFSSTVLDSFTITDVTGIADITRYLERNLVVAKGYSFGVTFG